MAEFSIFDGSQARPEPGWWATKSKKAPVGPGVNKAYDAMVKALEKYHDDMCYETARVALMRTQDLKSTAQKLPLIKSGLKKNEGFFLALKNSEDKLQKLTLQHKGESQTEKQAADTKAGKGSDGSDRSKDWAKLK
jgi:hypothetical protein